MALKHGGDDSDDNLCLSCAQCNRHKGSEVAALDPLTGEQTRLFHPRRQAWDEPFAISPDASLAGKRPEGRATVRVLRMNQRSRVAQRHIERLLDNYPCQTNP